MAHAAPDWSSRCHHQLQDAAVAPGDPADRVASVAVTAARAVGAATAHAATAEAAGIKDILSKSLGSSNAINIVHATIDGLRSLQRPEDVARRRGKTVEEVAPAYLLRPKVVTARAGPAQAEPTANSRS